MADVQGPGEGLPPLSRRDKDLYQKEYVRGADLFQRALSEYQKTPEDEIFKKEAFHEVMDRAMQILNETARELKRNDLMDLNQKIADAYQHMDSSQLDQDLKKAQKMV